jgi:deoxyribose-phosphate aldolase
MTAEALGPDGRPYDLALAGLIDHTLLKPEAASTDIERLCAEAIAYGFAAVCVHPLWVRAAARALAPAPPGGTRRPAICAVAGFPHGAQLADVKAFEARRAVDDGAGEIDMVLPIGALKAADDEEVRRHVAAVVNACGNRARVKVILECCLLTDDEKRRACRIATLAGAAFVKTSTGFSTGGATEADVRLMRAAAGAHVGVKAAGGIRDREAALRMVAAGAARIGTSAGPCLVRIAPV